MNTEQKSNSKAVVRDNQRVNAYVADRLALKTGQLSIIGSNRGFGDLFQTGLNREFKCIEQLE